MRGLSDADRRTGHASRPAPSSVSLREPPSPTRGEGFEITGHASLFGVADLNGDVVAKGAFAASLGKGGAGAVKMLHQHEGRAPVGVWDEVREDDLGLFVRGRIFDWSPEARFARALSRAGAMDGLSIGFRSVRARREGRLRVLVEVDLWEVSLVTFPMLVGARFTPSAR
ncbi:MAG: HK97 family phage prohead protease [Caulobacteraceae bacterium]|nr:HK97 family phage prohead protease [Caulobacteraceae bacterium]